LPRKLELSSRWARGFFGRPVRMPKAGRSRLESR
jgi:hypothetical protein